MLAVLDVVVGLAFVAAAAVAVGPPAERALIGAVGAAWLLGSIVEGASIAHQGVLVVALLAFPAGRIRGVLDWAIVVAATLVALGYVPQFGVVALFAVTAVVAIAGDPVTGWYPAVAAGLIAMVLAWVWSTGEFTWRSWSPTDGLVAYETVLLLVAVGFVVATRLGAIHRDRLADRLLTDERLEGLDGLARVLRQTLDDPDLRLLRWDDAAGGYLDSAGRPPSTDPTRRLLTVGGPGRRVAAVEHRSLALDDPPTTAGVIAAVELVEANARLQEALRTQLDELEAARQRIVAATDRQRAMIAARLREDVVAPVESAVGELRRTPVGRASAAVVDIAVQELAGAAAEIDTLVAGVPRERLGGGRLVEAVRMLARSSPVSVTVTAFGDPAADADIETTLLYVVSEAVTNTAKHAGASAVTVTIAGSAPGAVSVTIADDGRGGADARGSGLQGLADRVAARGGELEVHSPPGAGTTIIAKFVLQPILVHGFSTLS
jgi:signal transduction histidine kinase